MYICAKGDDYTISLIAKVHRVFGVYSYHRTCSAGERLEDVCTMTMCFYAAVPECSEHFWKRCHTLHTINSEVCTDT